MNKAELCAYNSLRILRALETVGDSGGRMRRRDLAFLAREIGNAVVELGYVDKDGIADLLGEPLLFESICSARHLLAHDENSFPPNRLLAFFKASGALRIMAESLLSIPEIARERNFAEKYLCDDSDIELSFDPASLKTIPWRPGDADYAALCFAIMLKEVEWRNDPVVERVIDFIARADLMMSICGAGIANFPHKKVGSLRRILLSGSEESESRCIAFFKKYQTGILGSARTLLSRSGFLLLARELCGWIEENSGKFRILRAEFARNWMESGGELFAPAKDSLLSGIYRDEFFQGKEKNTESNMRPGFDSPCC